MSKPLSSSMPKGVDLGTVTRHHKWKGVERYLRHANNPGGLQADWHLLDVLREQGFEYDPRVDNKSVKDISRLYIGLSHYGIKRAFRPDPDRWAQVVGRVKATFGCKSEEVRKACTLYAKLPTSELIIDRLSTSSGYPNFVKKSEDLVAARGRADLLTQRLLQGRMSSPPCVAYARVQHGEAGPKTRLVWGYPFEMTLIESRFARPLIQHFLSVRTPMTVGLQRFQLGARLSRLCNSSLVYGIDFSKFDASISPRLIDLAFRVLSSYFEFDSDLKVLWDFVVHYFIHTPIILPDGYMYRKHSGVPSGSYFTQVIDSIINYAIIQYCALTITGDMVSNDYIFVLGDDSIFALTVPTRIDHFANLCKAFGLVVNVEKSSRGTLRGVTYLGHTWDRLLCDRPVDELFKRLVFPERRSANDDPGLVRNTRLCGLVSDSASFAPAVRKTIVTSQQWVHSVWYDLKVLDDPISGYSVWLDTMGVYQGRDTAPMDQPYVGPLQ